MKTQLGTPLSLLHQAVTLRLTAFFNKTEHPQNMLKVRDIKNKDRLEKLLKRELSLSEQLLFLIAIAPHIEPHFFDDLIQTNIPEAGDIPQLGGMRGKNFRGFLPTGETALFRSCWWRFG